MGNLTIELFGVKFHNPVWVASGTFSYGKEMAAFYDLNELGAIVTKTITKEPRQGNPPPRLAETASGMLNTIGLQNPGIDKFISEEMAFLTQYEVPVIANIAGHGAAEFAELAGKLDPIPKVAAIELNLSCPNVAGGLDFSTEAKQCNDVIALVRKQTKKPIIAKLSPNVTDIGEMAKAAEGAGANAISAINTILGMSIDIWRKKTKLSAGMGGLSGPAIKPVAVRMVWQIAQAVKIPVIGIGGIMTWEDVIEFFLAGASAIQVGTANFVDPMAPIKIADGIEKYLTSMKVGSVRDLVGKVTIPFSPVHATHN